MKNIIDRASEINGVYKQIAPDFDGLLVHMERKFKLSTLAKCGRHEKRSGSPIGWLFMVVTAMPFLACSTVRKFLSSPFTILFQEQSKFAIARFLNSPLFNWRHVMYEINKKIKAQDDVNDDSVRRPTALLVDDSLLAKTGRRMEGVSSLFDHVTGRYRIGYKLLGLAWFNGVYTRMLDFALVAEKDIKVSRKFTKVRPVDSAGAERKRELNISKISLASEMIKRAVRHKFIPDYVMFDSWFTCAELINLVRRLAKGSMHVLAMVKDGKRKFTFGTQSLTLGQLRKLVMEKKKIKQCRKFNSYYVEVECTLPDVGQVKIFFSKIGRRGKWVALLTTNLNLKYSEAVELYAIRWSIEVLFKESKGLLGLGKCQSSHFDAQIAHCTCVLMQHAMLGSIKCDQQYKTIGGLFQHRLEEQRALTLIDRLLMIFEELLGELSESMGISNLTIGQFLNTPEFNVFMNTLRNSTITNSAFEKNRQAA